MSAIGVAFEIPSVFREVVPGLSTAQAEAEVRARLEDDHGVCPPPGRIAPLTAAYERTSALLATTDLRYAATCFRHFHGAWSVGTLTLGLSPLTYRDTAAALAGIGTVLAEHGSGTDARTLELPCGTAAFTVRRPEPPRGSGGAPGPSAATAQLQVFIPVPPDAVPGAQALATVVFSAPGADPWAEHCALVLPFLRSLRFVPEEVRAGAGWEDAA
ncbi:hypothetical protein [Streptomyces catenulae]|uniref:Uncharacterized protein n=1 Tax=Streptomyces catenulae TaxID=66875 RepID=A0ABV2YTI9_9ACTN|nr:hypothetical protein [Streptomyces catenulae]